MSTSTVHIKYRCFNDCGPVGCPGHTLVAHYQGASDVLSFGIHGEPPNWWTYLDVNKLQALVKLIAALRSPVLMLEDLTMTPDGVEYGEPSHNATKAGES